MKLLTLKSQSEQIKQKTTNKEQPKKTETDTKSS
jgi:hypothetical protein